MLLACFLGSVLSVSLSSGEWPINCLVMLLIEDLLCQHSWASLLRSGSLPPQRRKKADRNVAACEDLNLVESAACDRQFLKNEIEGHAREVSALRKVDNANTYRGKGRSHGRFPAKRTV